MKVRYLLFIILAGILFITQETEARDCTIVTVSGYSAQCQECVWEGDYLKFTLDGERKQVREENLVKIEWIGAPTAYDEKFTDDILNHPRSDMIAWIQYVGGNPYDPISLSTILTKSIETINNHLRVATASINAGLGDQALTRDEIHACGTVIIASALLIDLDPLNKGMYYGAIGLAYMTMSEPVLARKYLETSCYQYGDENGCGLLKSLNKR
ncbi:MAG: hypothetical protein JW765_13375 [Deltaproteobacteria bacterium]|nr:hypothetical protein [Candidatus Zymogenaceae bacterium]